ncbi:pyruvate phosphate dikinase, PEP/pyruvate-binding [Alkaliphilus metalliredigens QYMF]|uniref:Pyruvate phosphate dikinase, PEP/pyruvate-binding n=1 Tax=Alkaliphilus metalliredigens (strain QYMF) TaxID=293826 RepID=A6TPG0_ALKMQ|nr:PEP/pyruvate-binding domain-containing protein [Alkaliphilus metalliredigens]ABR48078.1 pyruvate phosphate dikinase, PEP/pyruvate-binding [Alkaliphilus metalliredigens QYMF]
MIIFFSDKKKVNLKDVGGKGLNLIHMIQAGLPVPKGFVVTTEAYTTFIKENNLEEKIHTLIKDLSADDMMGLEDAFQKIENLFQEAKIPSNIHEHLNSAYGRLDSLAVAVRSSATAEDLPEMSFAGQHDTYLNIIGEKEILEKIKSCWLSLWNPRAISYRLRQGVPQGDDQLGIAVVVQEMAVSEKAGVMFGANPLNNRRDQILINASWGLGESVVSGIVTPDQFVIDKSSKDVIESKIGSKEVQIIQQKQGIKKEKVPQERQKISSLNEIEIEKLYNMSETVENYYGEPMDIEWVIGNEEAYLVQARPITGLFPLAESYESPNEKGLQLYLSFNRIAQQVSEPFTAMGLEIMRLEMWGVLAMMGINLGKYPRAFKVAAGRVHFDLTPLLRNPKVWPKISGNLAKKDPIAGKVLMEFLEKNKEEITSVKSKIKLPPKFFYFVFKFAKKAIGAMLQPDQAEKRSVDLAKKHIHEIEKAREKAHSNQEKIRLIEDKMKSAMEVIVLQCAYFTPGTQAEERVSNKLEKWFGSNEMLAPVIRALPNNPTTRMGLQLVKMAYDLKSKKQTPDPKDPMFQKFLEEFGHRSNMELDVGIPRWKEEPDYIINILKNYIEQDPEGLQMRLLEHKEEAEKATLAIVEKVKDEKGKFRAWKIKKDLQYMRKLLGLREQPKFDLIKSFALFREILLEIGEDLVTKGRIEKASDVFFIKFSDILKEKGSLVETVNRYKAECEKQKQIKTIPRFIINTGECLYGSTEASDGDGLQGVPISSGEYTGIVRVVHDPRNAVLKKGEILVTHSTDPTWTPLFISAGALVMETGGPISHGGIVAREYGIPAVSGIEELNKKLSTGDEVTVNGNSGEVILKKNIKDDK